MSEPRPPLPPYTADTARQKVRMAEDAWNSRDPDRVVGVYTEDTRWRNRAEFPVGRVQVKEFLQRKWARELDYRLIKELWAFDGARIAVRFAYEFHDDSGQWFRSYGKRELGVQPARSDGAPLRQHQRLANPRRGAPVPLAARPPPRRPREPERPGVVTPARQPATTRLQRRRVHQLLGTSTHMRSNCFMRPACCSAVSPQPQK